MALSEEQQTLVAAMARGDAHVIGQARAGTGKTRALIAGVQEIMAARPAARILVTAFNRRVAQELEERLGAPRNVKIQTLHALGHSTLRLHRGQVTVDKNKGWTIARRVAQEFTRAAWQGHGGRGGRGRDGGGRRGRRGGRAGETMELTDKTSALAAVRTQLKPFVDLMKSVQPRDEQTLGDWAESEHLCSHHVSRQDWIDMTKACLRQTVEKFDADSRPIDFSDMLYLPRKLGLRPLPFDYVVVDECQDLTPGQLYLIEAALAPGGRFTFIGDKHQCIYGFAGARVTMMDELAAHFSAAEYPLSVTYRCAPAIVDYVRHTMGESFGFTSGRAEGGQGEVVYTKLSDMVGPYGARPGDYVLSRLNAPLLPLAMHFAYQGLPFVLEGKDFLGHVDKLLARAKKDKAVYDLRSLTTWLVRQHAATSQTYQAALETEERPEDAERKALEALGLVETTDAEGAGTGITIALPLAAGTRQDRADDGAGAEDGGSGGGGSGGIGSAPADVDAAFDAVQGLLTLCSYAESIDDIEESLQRLQSAAGGGREDVITLSSVHKAKGHERDRVWLLQPTFSDRATAEGTNIYYVACTRAKDVLFIVQEPDEAEMRAGYMLSPFGQLTLPDATARQMTADVGAGYFGAQVYGRERWER